MNRTRGILLASILLTMIALMLSFIGGSRTPSGRQPARASLLSLELSTSHLLQGSGGELYLDISLHPPLKEAAARLPLNLGLVIDRSGSMAGQKLTHARRAARQLVTRLRQGDRIAIITYGSDVTLLVPSTIVSGASRQSILELIDTITDRGGTFLSGGLDQAREEVLRHGRQGRVNRVILISDGQANEGLTDRLSLSTLARETQDLGVHLTTMGVGLDFNEETLTAMADHGGGHYYFIQNAERLSGFFTRELDTMQAIVAQDASLRLTLHPGVVLERVYGHAYEAEDSGRRITIQLPDLFAGGSRKVMCKIRVPTSRAGKLGVARIDLSYRDPRSGRMAVLSSSKQVVVTSTSALVDRGNNAQVLARIEQVQAAATMQEAMEAYSHGHVARSRTLLEQQIERTLRANQKLKREELDELIDTLNLQARGTASAPSSMQGRSLVKKAKYRAYRLGK